MTYSLHSDWKAQTAMVHKIAEDNQMNLLFEKGIDEGERGHRNTRFLQIVRNLYEAVEGQLNARKDKEHIAKFYDPQIHRVQAIDMDLAQADAQEFSPSMLREVEIIKKLADHELLAYSFTIHMANLAGGQHIKRAFSRFESLRPMVATYSFPEIADAKDYRQRNQERLNSLGEVLTEKERTEFMKASIRAFMDFDFAIRSALIKA